MKIMPTNLKIEENDNKSFNSFLKILKLVIFQTQRLIKGDLKVSKSFFEMKLFYYLIL